MDIETKLDLDLSLLYTELEKREGDIVETIKQEAIKECPVDTGYMKSTIEATVGEREATVYVGATYAPYTELRGSSKGWFTRAIQNASSAVKRIWTR